MKRAQMNLLCHFIQVGLITKIFIDKPDRFFNSLIICHNTKLGCDRAVANPKLANLEHKVQGERYEVRIETVIQIKIILMFEYEGETRTYILFELVPRTSHLVPDSCLVLNSVTLNQ